jgi:DNA-binding Lrp family transcriptional regulator
MHCPEVFKNIPTLDIRSHGRIRAGGYVVALLTSDNGIMWEDDYLRYGLPEGTTLRCRIIDNDSYNNSGADWIDSRSNEDEDEQIFNFYGFEGEDWLDNIKRRALAVIDKPAWRYLHYDDSESDEDSPDGRPSSGDEEKDEENGADDLSFSGSPSSRRRADFTQVDWSLSNTEIAQQLGVSPSAVYYQRKQHRPDTIVKKYRKVDFTKVDWSLSNETIAEQFGATPGYIAFQRKVKSPYTVIEKVRKVDYTKVDWSLPDKEIALKFNTTRKNIRRQRRVRTNIQCIAEEKEDKYSDVDWSLSDREIAMQLDVWPTTIYNQRKRRNSNNKKCTIDYLQINLSSYNRKLSERTGFSQKIIKNNRKKYCLEAAAPCIPQATNACKHKENSEKNFCGDKYADIDWAQTNMTLARQFGVSPTTITYWRRKKGKLKISKDKYLDVDWSNTNVELAQSLGVSTKTLAKQRKKRKIAPADGTIKKIDYSNVDWTQPNKIIAKQLGVSTVTISYQRRLRDRNILTSTPA